MEPSASPPDRLTVDPLFKRITRTLSIPSFSILFAGLLAAIVLEFSGISPWEAFSALFEGSVGNFSALARTIEKATPLILSGLAVAFALKAGLFNIGTQGQLLFGALISAVVGYSVKGLPAPFHLFLCLAAGAAAGGAYGALQGALKAYTGAHEVITGIMLNFVAINMTDYLTNSVFKDSSPGNIIARTPLILETSHLPDIQGVSLGFVMSLALAAFVGWMLSATTTGFEIKTIGKNSEAARYAGMRVRFTLIVTMLVSGALAGIGGSVETLGVVRRFQPGFNVDLGFEGITIALLGRTNPFGVICAAILVGALKAGASNMQFVTGAAKEIVDVMLAFMLFFVAGDRIVKKILDLFKRDKTP